MEFSANAVGKDYRSGKPGEAQYYGKCTNYNSVSIELCDNEGKEPSDKQIKTVKELIAYIRKHCPNANTIVRHWDVNGKDCPSSYLLNNANWKAFCKKVAPDLKASTGCSSTGSSTVKKGQANANLFLDNHLPSVSYISEDGIRGPKTKKQCSKVLQLALNLDFDSGLAVDGIVGPKTKAVIKGKSVKKGQKSYLVLATKILYQCKGKDKGLKYSMTFGGGLQKTSEKTKIMADTILGLLE